MYYKIESTTRRGSVQIFYNSRGRRLEDFTRQSHSAADGIPTKILDRDLLPYLEAEGGGMSYFPYIQLWIVKQSRYHRRVKGDQHARFLHLDDARFVNSAKFQFRFLLLFQELLNHLFGLFHRCLIGREDRISRFVDSSDLTNTKQFIKVSVEMNVFPRCTTIIPELMK